MLSIRPSHHVNTPALRPHARHPQIYIYTHVCIYTLSSTYKLSTHVHIRARTHTGAQLQEETHRELSYKYDQSQMAGKQPDLCEAS